jgi:hypothetical protein
MKVWRFNIECLERYHARLFLLVTTIGRSSEIVQPSRGQAPDLINVHGRIFRVSKGAGDELTLRKETLVWKRVSPMEGCGVQQRNRC